MAYSFTNQPVKLIALLVKLSKMNIPGKIKKIAFIYVRGGEVLRAKLYNSGQRAQIRGLLSSPVVEISLSILSQNYELTKGHEENRGHRSIPHVLGPVASMWPQ